MLREIFENRPLNVKCITPYRKRERRVLSRRKCFGEGNVRQVFEILRRWEHGPRCVRKEGSRADVETRSGKTRRAVRTTVFERPNA